MTTVERQVSMKETEERSADSSWLLPFIPLFLSLSLFSGICSCLSLSVTLFHPSYKCKTYSQARLTDWGYTRYNGTEMIQESKRRTGHKSNKTEDGSEGHRYKKISCVSTKETSMSGWSAWRLNDWRVEWMGLWVFSLYPAKEHDSLLSLSQRPQQAACNSRWKRRKKRDGN